MNFVLAKIVPPMTDKSYIPPGRGFKGDDQSTSPGYPVNPFIFLYPTLPPRQDNDHEVVSINAKFFKHDTTRRGLTAIDRSVRRGVYKFRYAGVIYYRLGYGCQDALLNLRRELGSITGNIETLGRGEGTMKYNACRGALARLLMWDCPGGRTGQSHRVTPLRAGGRPYSGTLEGIG